MKIGSLFDGSGGFPLAASMCGIEPVWASEIEPYPIAVTRSRFPNMKHLGSITDVHGDEVEPVDVITFGSPCQDLSVAGKRAGLKHTENGDDETTRSGLFMEAVRIIKEMRKATNGEYPRFAVWENVPGAFSSNKGADFRVVLEELIRIAEPTAVMPEVPKAGWPYADVYCGDSWSLAYRVLDAQYWGVPQRRRRIYLVADFGGKCAGKISFEREGLRGYFAQSGTQREAVAGDAESGVGTADSGVIPYTLKIRGGVEVDSAGKAAGKGALIQKNMSATLGVSQDQYLFQPVKEQHLFENHSQDSRYRGPLDICPMLPAQLGTGGNNQPFVVEEEPVCYNGENITSPLNKTNPKPGDPCHTLGTDSRNYLVYCLQGGGATSQNSQGMGYKADSSYTLNTTDMHGVVYAETYQKVTGPLMANSHPGSYTGQDAYNDMFVVGKEDVAGVDCRNLTEHEELYPTLQAKPNGGQSLNFSGAVRVKYIVRRLTPTECARLQGFPDEWGHPDVKTELTDEEYAFWLNVRNTHATINDKATKEYTREQMLTWYNKLHTDSSEYKLWGNGIALPCALYVMQGIAEVSNEN